MYICYELDMNPDYMCETRSIHVLTKAQLLSRPILFMNDLRMLKYGVNTF